MKGKQYQLSKLKKQLRERKEYGTKVLRWSLKEDQAEYIEMLGYEVQPYLYTIRTKQIPRQVRQTDALLKEIHYKNKQGKRNITLKLKPKQIKVLERHGIKFRVAKYSIYLQRQLA